MLKKRLFFAMLFLLTALSCSLPQAAQAAKYVLQVKPAAPSQWPKSPEKRELIMNKELNIVLRRLENLGIKVSDSRIEGDNKLVIITANNNGIDEQKLRKLLTSSITIEFYTLSNVRGISHQKAKWDMEAPASADDGYIFTGPKQQQIDSKKQPNTVLEKVVNYKHNKPVLTGKYLLTNANAVVYQMGRIVVNIAFNSEGTRIFRDYTRRHVGDYLAVFFNGRLLTAPTINEPIPSGKAEITGFRSLEEARQTAALLNAGALPLPLKIVSIN